MNATQTLPKTIRPGDELEVQLSPFGNFPGMRGDERVIQRCDRAAFAAVVKNFRPEVLVDFEHHAETGGDTEAAAWVQCLRVDPVKGLLATFRFTDAGASAVANRRLRFLSPVWELDPAGRPTRLVSVGLTNKPNLPVRPVLNTRMEPRAATGKPQGRGAKPHPETIRDSRFTIHVFNTNKGTTMEPDTNEPTPAAPDFRARLLEILGLGPDADDAVILQAAENLAQVAAEAQEAALNAEADAVAEENKDKIANRDAFKRLYVANRDAVRATLACLKAPAPAPAARPVCNAARRPAAPANPLAACNSPEERCAAIERGLL